MCFDAQRSICDAAISIVKSPVSVHKYIHTLSVFVCEGHALESSVAAAAAAVAAEAAALTTTAICVCATGIICHKHVSHHIQK